jgi:hypothetical protein
MPAAEAAHRLLALAIRADRLKDDVTGGWQRAPPCVLLLISRIGLLSWWQWMHLLLNHHACHAALLPAWYALRS